MDVDALLDAYVRDVARLLPRKQRADIALELRELVREELLSRAEAQRRPLDATVALEGLQAFGRPAKVAARYTDPLTIIPASETRRFSFAAIIGALVLVALAPLGSAPFSESPSHLDQAILAWLGALVAFFGIRSWWERHAATRSRWQPHDHDHMNRAGALTLIVLIAAGIVAYAAPDWLFAQFSHHPLPAQLSYAPTFHAHRLPVLFAVWACQAALFAVLAARGHWTPMLRRVEIGLEVAVILTLAWFLVPGELFREAATNQAALAVVRAIVSLMIIDVGIKLYRGLGSMPPVLPLPAGATQGAPYSRP